MAKLWPKPTIGNVRGEKTEENVSKLNKDILDTIIEEVDIIISPDCLPAPLPTSPCKKSFEIVRPDDVLGDVELHQPTEKYS